MFTKPPRLNHYVYIELNNNDFEKLKLNKPDIQFILYDTPSPHPKKKNFRVRYTIERPLDNSFLNINQKCKNSTDQEFEFMLLYFDLLCKVYQCTTPSYDHDVIQDRTKSFNMFIVPAQLSSNHAYARYVFLFLKLLDEDQAQITISTLNSRTYGFSFQDDLIRRNIDIAERMSKNTSPTTSNNKLSLRQSSQETHLVQLDEEKTTPSNDKNDPFSAFESDDLDVINLTNKMADRLDEYNVDDDHDSRPIKFKDTSSQKCELDDTILTSTLSEGHTLPTTYQLDPSNVHDTVLPLLNTLIEIAKLPSLPELKDEELELRRTIYKLSKSLTSRI